MAKKKAFAQVATSVESTTTQATTKHARSSNFELLRIVAMLMIIAFHIFLHAVKPQLTDADLIARVHNGYFSHPVIYSRLLIVDMLALLGAIANDIFILITGYFSANKASGLNVTKSTKKLLSQQLFAAVFLVLSSPFIRLAVEAVGKNVNINTVDIGYFNSMAWFVSYYLLIILIGKLFLNKFLDSLDQNKYLGFVLIVFALCQFGWTSGLLDSIGSGLHDVLNGVFLYSLGGYIRKYKLFDRVRTSAIWVVIAGVLLLVTVSAYNLAIGRIADYIQSGSEGLFTQNIIGVSNSSFVVVVLAVCIFELFRRLKLGHSRVINFLGSATFMVYLVHENAMFWSLWSAFDWPRALAKSPTVFIFALLVVTVAVFIFGVLVYILYLGLRKLAKKFVAWAIVSS